MINFGKLEAWRILVVRVAKKYTRTIVLSYRYLQGSHKSDNEDGDIKMFMRDEAIMENGKDFIKKFDSLDWSKHVSLRGYSYIGMVDVEETID